MSNYDVVIIGVEGRDMRRGLLSPTRYQRLAGALYLTIIFVGILGPLLTRERLVVSGHPSATAENIAASPGLWRLGIALDLVMQVCDVPVMLILFLLLSSVNRNVARLALLFNIVQTATLVANQQTLVAAQLAAPDHPKLVDVAVQAYSTGEALGLVFFGFTLLGTGYLIRHSAYLPWVVGLLVQLAGAGYVVDSFTLLVLPDAPELVHITLLLPAFVGEVSLALWLAIRGVDASKFEAVRSSALGYALSHNRGEVTDTNRLSDITETPAAAGPGPWAAPVGVE